MYCSNCCSAFIALAWPRAPLLEVHIVLLSIWNFIVGFCSLMLDSRRRWLNARLVFISNLCSERHNHIITVLRARRISWRLSSRLIATIHTETNIGKAFGSQFFLLNESVPGSIKNIWCGKHNRSSIDILWSTLGKFCPTSRTAPAVHIVVRGEMQRLMGQRNIFPYETSSYTVRVCLVVWREVCLSHIVVGIMTSLMSSFQSRISRNDCDKT